MPETLQPKTKEEALSLMAEMLEIYKKSGGSDEWEKTYAAAERLADELGASALEIFEVKFQQETEDGKRGLAESIADGDVVGLSLRDRVNLLEKYGFGDLIDKKYDKKF